MAFMTKEEAEAVAIKVHKEVFGNFQNIGRKNNYDIHNRSNNLGSI